MVAAFPTLGADFVGDDEVTVLDAETDAVAIRDADPGVASVAGEGLGGTRDWRAHAEDLFPCASPRAGSYPVPGGNRGALGLKISRGNGL